MHWAKKRKEYNFKSLFFFPLQSIVTSHENSESDEAAEGQDKDKGLIGYNQSSFDQLDQLLVWINYRIISFSIKREKRCTLTSLID